ncbi:MAG: hypothetical protein JRC91_01520 [Deltaproteobacteria bacterium]|nr:hypothetical protein [Deltaproteobacteria bacterium]
MSIKKNKRTVNKKLIMAMAAYNELNLKTMGLKCDPPVSRACMSMLVGGKNFSRRLIIQVSDILHVPDAILFPYTETESCNDQ